MKKTLEEKTADTILETIQEVRIGKETFLVAPPTVATLIQVSALISQMPEVNRETDNIIEETLRIAKDSQVLGEILAVLILGAEKGPRTSKGSSKPLFFRFRRKRKITHKVLAEKILFNISPNDLNDLISQLFSSLEIGGFFACFAFLTSINLLKATRKAKETTASGL